MDSQSTGQRILAARARMQAYHEETFESIEGLWVTYTPVEFRKVRAIGAAHEGVRSEIDREVLAGADLLLAACVRCEARVDGATQPLPKLGMALNEALGTDACESDRQAVIWLFGEQLVVSQAFKVAELEGSSNPRVDSELAKNSEAVAS